ncbi:hypothetical protein ACIQZI_19610 [Peribacillus sp. NPDC096379]|uniref:hypothetical protein n=1 Tax=Peribacillus sp. NPDC096379 TaxID=3364393 RepID=UPI00380E6B82
MYDFVYFRTFKSLITLDLIVKITISYVEYMISEENHERKERAAIANGQRNRGYETSATAIWFRTGLFFICLWH